MIKSDIIQIEDLIDKRAEELAKNSYNKFQNFYVPLYNY